MKYDTHDFFYLPLKPVNIWVGFEWFPWKNNTRLPIWLHLKRFFSVFFICNSNKASANFKPWKYNTMGHNFIFNTLCSKYLICLTRLFLVKLRHSEWTFVKCVRTYQILCPHSRIKLTAKILLCQLGNWPILGSQFLFRSIPLKTYINTSGYSYYGLINQFL